ncbi:hypothetical protein [Magnetospira sp. QH-2]|uniref:hypothetical protein n=1 Tax=Magnetospira sp. (strain QH-2) TaxID=1288970 RepID=UPI0011DCC012|nr:hypothetical protein [Magnetospira sp. QH-2]
MSPYKRFWGLARDTRKQGHPVLWAGFLISLVSAAWAGYHLYMNLPLREIHPTCSERGNFQELPGDYVQGWFFRPFVKKVFESRIPVKYIKSEYDQGNGSHVRTGVNRAWISRSDWNKHSGTIAQITNEIVRDGVARKREQGFDFPIFSFERESDRELRPTCADVHRYVYGR